MVETCRGVQSTVLPWLGDVAVEVCRSTTMKNVARRVFNDRVVGVPWKSWSLLTEGAPSCRGSCVWLASLRDFEEFLRLKYGIYPSKNEIGPRHFNTILASKSIDRVD